MKSLKSSLRGANQSIEVGYKALLLSVDVPVLGQRLGEMRNRFRLPPNLSFPNITSTGRDEFETGGGMALH